MKVLWEQEVKGKREVGLFVVSINIKKIYIILHTLLTTFPSIFKAHNLGERGVI
jgi:hypothetical protein